MRILVVDDQRAARRIISKILEPVPAVDLTEAKSLAEAVACIASSLPDLVLLDIRLSSDPDDRGGFELLRREAHAHPGLTVVIVSASSEIDLIRGAMRLGAKDYVLKDELSPELLIPIVEGFRERMDLRGEVARLRERAETNCGLSAIIGTSAVIEQLRALVARVADSDATVLIRGETGAGKELVARALHETSSRRELPFVAVNCSALPPTHMESLLFGHERGAFRWADSRRPGQLELAGGGTVLLDDVADMPRSLQAKLLRVLEDRRFRPVGAADERRLEARVLASTHLDLKTRLASGQFRDDLYYRLSVVTIEVPSLAEHRSDIVDLVSAFAAALPRKVRFTDDAIVWLSLRTWSGNVRELRNTVERVSLLAEETTVDSVALEGIVERRVQTREAQELDELACRVLALPDAPGHKIERVVRAMIARAMDASGGNKSEAARLLGMDRRTLERRWQIVAELGDDEEPGDAF